MKRLFDAGDILSVWSGRLVSPNGLEGLCRILSYMTGESIYTHQIPRAMGQCRPWLLRQHPWLEKVVSYPTAVPDGEDKIFAKNWVRAAVTALGGFGQEPFEMYVEPIPEADRRPQDPLAGLVDMVGPERVVVVGPSS